jgi:hypothetical protein
MLQVLLSKAKEGDEMSGLISSPKGKLAFGAKPQSNE